MGIVVSTPDPSTERTGLVPRTNRRRFLGALGVLAVSSTIGRGSNSPAPQRLVSVTGEVTAGEAGVILPHEHVMSLFGADLTEVPVYDREALLEAVVPYLRRLRRLGCGTLADCTTAYFGRAPELLREISEASGIRILTNTGYYAAANDRYVPPHAYRESEEWIARRWIAEWREGIGETGIRPGFIKTGVDDGPLSAIDGKIVRAAAITHRETGLTIASHTGDNPASAVEQLRILREEGVAAEAWIWVHAQNVEDPRLLLPALEEGAWIELDGISPENAARHFEFLEFLRERGHGGRLLLSHDGNSFRYGGHPAKPYDGLFTAFVPLLRDRGLSEGEIRGLVSDNPFRALAPRLRRL